MKTCSPKLSTHIRSALLFTSLVFSSLENIAVSAETVCCSPLSQDQLGVVLTQAALPVTIAMAIAVPLMAGFSNTAEPIALASGILNSVNILAPIANSAVSWYMEKHADHDEFGSGQTCGAVPCVTTIRNGLVFGLNVSAAAMAWVYVTDGNDQFRVVNTTLTTVSSVVTIVGTSLMYYCLYPGFMRNSAEERKYLLRH